MRHTHCVLCQSMSFFRVMCVMCACASSHTSCLLAGVRRSVSSGLNRELFVVERSFVETGSPESRSETQPTQRVSGFWCLLQTSAPDPAKHGGTCGDRSCKSVSRCVLLQQSTHSSLISAPSAPPAKFCREQLALETKAPRTLTAVMHDDSLPAPHLVPRSPPRAPPPKSSLFLSVNECG